MKRNRLLNADVTIRAIHNAFTNKRYCGACYNEPLQPSLNVLTAEKIPCDAREKALRGVRGHPGLVAGTQEALTFRCLLPATYDLRPATDNRQPAGRYRMNIYSQKSTREQAFRSSVKRGGGFVSWKWP